MTDYGRGRGPEPWHPEDPLYGDQGWGAQQAVDGHTPYDAQPQAQQPHPQQSYDPQYDGGGWDTGQQQYAQQPQQQHPQQPHPQQQQYDPQYDGGGWDTGQQQYVQQQHQPQQHPQHQPQYPQQQQQQQYAEPQYGQQQYAGQQPNNPQYDGGWDTGQQAAMPYGENQGDPYAGQQGGGYGGESPDGYGTNEAYPPPRRQAAPPPPPPEPENDWDGPQPEETHPFFTGEDRDDNRNDDADDREYDDDAGDGRRGGGGRDRRGPSKKKRRGGGACLVASLVLVGGAAGGGYYAYQFWQERFGPPADFSGAGTGSVQVEIPQGAGLTEMGSLLKESGVVKSAAAFVDAAGEHPKGKAIQPGVYPMKKEMSAKAAVELMTNPANLNSLTIGEGTRAVKVYEFIDTKLKLEPGTTADVAKAQSGELGLPDWADDSKDIKDPLEGFLYPARYDIGEKTKPEDVLKQMVARSNQEYKKYDLEKSAEDLGLDSPLDVVTVASLVQAEGITHDDFKKMAAVVYNRLKPTNTDTNQKLEFDSTFNYLKNESEIDISTSEIRNHDDPYNTYFYKGLPPGPIGNPGADALNATKAPDPGGWMYFISIDGKTTEFTKTLAEHQKLVDKFNERRKNANE